MLSLKNRLPSWDPPKEKVEEPASSDENDDSDMLEDG
jgi:hypothetical protein